MSVTDDKGRITYCNPAFIEASGFIESELLGQPHNVVRHPDMPEEAFRDMWATLKSGRPWRGLVKNRRKNGDHYWVEANAMPLFDDQRIVGYVSLRTSVTAEAIQQAESTYARLRDDAKQGSGTWSLSQGHLIRTGKLGTLLRRLKPRIETVAFGAIFSGMYAAAYLGHAFPMAALPAAGAMALAISVLFAKKICSPLRDLLKKSYLLAAGDLTARIDRSGYGLIGELQHGLSQISLSVKTVVADTRHEIKNLKGSIGEIAAGNQDLSGRTENQASSLEETAASMEQITGTVKQTHDASARGAKTAQQMVQIAQASQNAVSRVADAMTSIDASAQKMREIIHVIEGVAFQTNILALNAAVEAARAGEAGRGFAVVATEVRTLAQRTTNAAREIKQLIEESTERVAAGGRETEEASTQMRQSVEAVLQVTSLLDEIATAAGEQQSGVAQIADAMTHLDSITQQNAAMVEQLAASAGTLRDQVDHVSYTMRLLRLSKSDASLAQADVSALKQLAKSPSQAFDANSQFDFSQAIAAHSQWKIKLRNAAENSEPLDVATISRDDCCPLGKWIHGEGKRWGHVPSFTALQSRHKTFHLNVGKVAEVSNAGNSRQALQMLEGGTPFAESTQSVIMAIRELMSDMKQAPAYH
ncbi:MAG: PAS domain-containing protein [Burkholderiales bacterium]|nr:PAS domain-containing protein [Burkholderiales bacterium]